MADKKGAAASSKLLVRKKERTTKTAVTVEVKKEVKKEVKTEMKMEMKREVKREVKSSLVKKEEKVLAVGENVEASGLVLCCLAVEYISFSKRFCPELINFLLGILHLAVQDKTSTGYSVVPPFRQNGKVSDLLVLSDPESSQTWSKKTLPLSATQTLTLTTDLDTDHYRLSAVATCMDLLKHCSSLYRELTSYSHIFQPITTLLSKHLPIKTYPAALQDLHGEILATISGSLTSRPLLVFQKKKPIPLKLFTPKIVEVLDYGKKRGNTKEESTFSDSSFI